VRNRNVRISTVSSLCDTIELCGVGWQRIQGEDCWADLGHEREVHISALERVLPDEGRQGVGNVDWAAIDEFCFGDCLILDFKHWR